MLILSLIALFAATVTIIAPGAAAVDGPIFTAVPDYRSYIALGDSYSLGVGLGSFSKYLPHQPEGCNRTDDSFPSLFNQLFKPGNFQWESCLGHDNDFIRPLTVDLPPPKSDPELGLISITFGLNYKDMFKNISDVCIFNPIITNTTHLRSLWDPACDLTLKAAETTIRHMQPAIEEMIQNVKSQVVQGQQLTHIVLMGYPRLFNIHRRCTTEYINWLRYPTKGHGGTRDRINHLVVKLNKKLEAAAINMNITYRDTDRGFEGRRLCDHKGGFEENLCEGDFPILMPSAPEWSWGGCWYNPGVLHPNRIGQGIYLNNLMEVAANDGHILAQLRSHNSNNTRLGRAF
ncbi:MAG: hypothetical protein M1834_004723 [Cirrosporium novae-zelandiae]|nr:MAG: hypothetical protein M1834_004723 [Cirrosporium novae-zelandiae]